MKEIWKQIGDFPGYDISNLGNVRSWHKYKSATFPYPKKASPTGCPPSGLHVILRRDKKNHIFLVHRLVLTAFVGPCPPGMEACHQDGNWRNNHLNNLRWDTHSENEKDKIRHGTSPQGVRNAQAKLTPKQVFEIRERYATGETIGDLVREFHVRPSAITRIVTGQRWKHVGGPIHQPGTHRSTRAPHGKDNYFGRHPELSRGSNNTRAILTETIVTEIRYRATQGERRKDLAYEYGVSKSCIDHIVTRISWSHIP